MKDRPYKANISQDVYSALIFRSFEPEDLESLARLEERAFPIGPYTKVMLSRIFKMKGSFSIVAEDRGKVVAYVIALPLDESSADIESIAVDPECQKTGLGSILIRRIEGMMVERGYTVSILEVRDKNEEAINFYRKHGYEIIAHMPKYYHEIFRGTRGAYRMKKFLTA